MRNLTITLIAVAACLTVFTNVQAQAAWSDYSFDRTNNGPIMTGLFNRDTEFSYDYESDYSTFGDFDLSEYGQSANNEHETTYSFSGGSNYGNGGYSGGYSDWGDNGGYGDWGDNGGYGDWGDNGGYGDWGDNGGYGDWGNNGGYGDWGDNGGYGDWGDNGGYGDWGDNGGYGDWGNNGGYGDWGDNGGEKPPAVPVPGAGVLSMLGMGIAGWLKRRKTL